jgi:hypothetical protein
MEERYEDQIDESLERLAFYFYRSAEPATALGYLERAAERAESLEQFERAESLWTRARRLSERVGDGEAIARFDVRLAELESRAAGSS